MTTFLTSQEIQELVGVDRSTVYRMAEDGRLPAVKVGRQWRFPADRIADQFGLAQNGHAQRENPAPVTGGQLGELLGPDDAQSVADLVGEALGVMALVTDLDGHPLSAVANPCDYYAAIADRPAAAEACLSQWRFFAEEPNVTPRWVNGHLGFLCARTFVWVDLKPIGMIVVGGVTPAVWPPAPGVVEAIADELGVPADALLDRVGGTWDLDVGQQRRVLQLLPQFADLISQLVTARSRTAGQPLADTLGTNYANPLVPEGAN